jgi:hypothetical protein
VTEQDIPLVCLLEDLARILNTSRRTIERRRASGVFPIPELPSIDKRPRYSRDDVLKYLANQRSLRGLRRSA